MLWQRAEAWRRETVGKADTPGRWEGLRPLKSKGEAEKTEAKERRARGREVDMDESCGQ